MCRCKCACCSSFVVVILVRTPATISMMSVTGMELISYWRPASGNRPLVVPSRDEDRISSLAKL